MKDFDIFINEVVSVGPYSDCILLDKPRVINIYDDFDNRYKNLSSGKRWRLLIRSVECWDFIEKYQLYYKRYPSVRQIMNSFDFEVLFQQPSLFS